MAWAHGTPPRSPPSNEREFAIRQAWAAGQETCAVAGRPPDASQIENVSGRPMRPRQRVLACRMQGRQGGQHHWTGLRVGHEVGCRPTTPGSLDSQAKHHRLKSTVAVRPDPPWAALALRHPCQLRWLHGRGEHPTSQPGWRTHTHPPLTAFSRSVVVGGGGHKLWSCTTAGAGRS